MLMQPPSPPEQPIDSGAQNPEANPPVSPEAEQPPAAPEHAPGVNQNAGVPPATTPSVPPASVQSAASAAQPAPPSAGPSAQTPAADSELIEKPWVEKAERIIEEDKADPKAEETDEQALNRDYLKARFNFDVHDSD